MKGKAAVSVPSDKRRLRRRAESMAVVKPAEDAARCSNYSYDRQEKSGVMLAFVVPYLVLSHIFTYWLTYSLAFLLRAHLLLGRRQRASD